jgi:hypothetical protein
MFFIVCARLTNHSFEMYLISSHVNPTLHTAPRRQSLNYHNSNRTDNLRNRITLQTVRKQRHRRARTRATSGMFRTNWQKFTKLGMNVITFETAPTFTTVNTTVPTGWPKNQFFFWSLHSPLYEMLSASTSTIENVLHATNWFKNIT